MADYTVGTNEVGSPRFSLVANKVSTVTFTDDVSGVQIWTDQTDVVFYTIDGRDPAVDSPVAHMIPIGTIATIETTPGGGDQVKLISAGSPVVRVERA